MATPRQIGDGSSNRHPTVTSANPRQLSSGDSSDGCDGFFSRAYTEITSPLSLYTRPIHTVTTVTFLKKDNKNKHLSGDGMLKQTVTTVTNRHRGR